jgi:hypothetical protein
MVLAVIYSLLVEVDRPCRCLAGRHLSPLTSLVTTAGTTLRVTIYFHLQHVMGPPPSYTREERV